MSAGVSDEANVESRISVRLEHAKKKVQCPMYSRLEWANNLQGSSSPEVHTTLNSMHLRHISFSPGKLVLGFGFGFFETPCSIGSLVGARSYARQNHVCNV